MNYISRKNWPKDVNGYNRHISESHHGLKTAMEWYVLRADSANIFTRISRAVNLISY